MTEVYFLTIVQGALKNTFVEVGCGVASTLYILIRLVLWLAYLYIMYALGFRILVVRNKADLFLRFHLRLARPPRAGPDHIGTPTVAQPDLPQLTLVLRGVARVDDPFTVVCQGQGDSNRDRNENEPRASQILVRSQTRRQPLHYIPFPSEGQRI